MPLKYYFYLMKMRTWVENKSGKTNYRMQKTKYFFCIK